MTVSKRIFLVEDHPDTARAVKRYLEAYGYSVELASDVTSALRVGSETEFDLLICDLQSAGWDRMGRNGETERSSPNTRHCIFGL
jgi:DNA-binding response OmpR family regulator